MRTTQIHMFIHDKPTIMTTTPKKSGKPSRPAKGPVIGVAVARVLSEETYGIQVSLAHPGHEVKGGWREGGDKFDKDIALRLAVGKLVSGDPLPFIFSQKPTTKRAALINQQFSAFAAQAAVIFKDKKTRL